MFNGGCLKWSYRDFLAVQWLGLHPSTAGRESSVLHGGTKIPHAMGGVAQKKIEFKKSSVKKLTIL